ncbi:MAG: 3-phosphoshikimate 1-carboxyvinyltransferase [Eubacteriaceae bacterium]
MKTVEINPQKLQGTLDIPPSKSVSHRVIIAACLGNGKSIVSNVLLSQDIEATCNAMENLGAKINYSKENDHRYTLEIQGIDKIQLSNQEVECNESGSTLRFMIPILLLQNQKVIVKGKGRLVTRPMKPYYEIFKEKKIKFEHLIEFQDLPLALEGKLTPGSYKLDGSVSSQFITGLLFALPLLGGDSEIEILSTLESKPYVDITLKVMKDFGIDIINEEDRRFIIKGNQSYQPCNYRVEGDFSQGAFWLVAGTLGESLLCKDLDLRSKQGDKVIFDLINEMGGQLTIQDSGILTKPIQTKGITIDVSQCPDLVPILGVLGSLSSGRTEIVNGERLRFKESDRLMATAEVLNALGGKVEETKDGLIIEGVTGFTGGRVKSHNDHRIAMAVAIASLAANGKITLDGAEAVNKSYPHFWEDFKKMGGDVHGIDLGE